jgi:predicted nucleic acid-binding protein
VIVYLDASVIVALLTQDLFTDRAKAFLSRGTPALMVSDYAAAEYASVVARRVRTKALTVADGLAAFSTLDVWTARAARRVDITSADIVTATGFLRRLDLTLRTPDAVNIAIAQRVGATLATFDTQMAANAVTLGLSVAAV